jgi:hypothetical protein
MTAFTQPHRDVPPEESAPAASEPTCAFPCACGDTSAQDFLLDIAGDMRMKPVTRMMALARIVELGEKRDGIILSEKMREQLEVIMHDPAWPLQVRVACAAELLGEATFWAVTENYSIRQHG